MKEIWNWLVKNFSNLFTIIGIVLTVYFSLFYVPDYIRDNENERVKNINADLIESVQEVVYNNYELDQKQIEALIKGKEIKFKIEYPYSPNELLIQTQETFMANKFIPLNERVQVVKKIDSIRNNLKLNIPVNETNKEDKFFSAENSKLLITIISIILGLLTGILGVFSFVTRLKKERAEKINEEVELKKESIQERIIKQINFEYLIKGIFAKNGIEYVQYKGSNDLGYDYLLKVGNDIKLAVSIKYIGNNSENLSSFEKLFQPFKESPYPGIIILNRNNPKLHFYLRKIYKQDDKERLHLIFSNQVDQIEKQLLDIINNYRQSSR